MSRHMQAIATTPKQDDGTYKYRFVIRTRRPDEQGGGVRSFTATIHAKHRKEAEATLDARYLRRQEIPFFPCAELTWTDDPTHAHPANPAGAGEV